MIKVNVFEEEKKDSFLHPRMRMSKYEMFFKETKIQKLMPLLRKYSNKIKCIDEILETFDEDANPKKDLNKKQKILNYKADFLFDCFIVNNESLFRASDDDINEQAKNEYLIWIFKQHPTYIEILDLFNETNCLEKIDIDYEDSIGPSDIDYEDSIVPSNFNYDDFGDGITYDFFSQIKYDECSPRKHKEKANWGACIIDNGIMKNIDF